MLIQTKYEIGQRVWMVYENDDELCVYDDTIAEIVIDDKKIYYVSKNTHIDISEEDIVLYEDTDKLAVKIKQTMKEIREREENE